MLPAEETSAAAAQTDLVVEQDLLSSVCHDLKEPLASIVMGAGFLKKVLPPDDASTRRVLDAIHRAAERMSLRIATFSDLAKLQKHDIALEIQAYDVVALTKAAFDAFVPLATERRMSVTLEVPTEGPVMVSCDRERLLQIARHLGAAVLRVAPEQASAVVRAAPDGHGAVRFEIVTRRSANAGARRINADLPKPELAIARGLIHLHGSQLAIDGDGDVLSLRFSLPLRPAAPSKE